MRRKNEKGTYGKRKSLPTAGYHRVSICSPAFVLQTKQGNKNRQWKERTERGAYEGGIQSKIQLWACLGIQINRNVKFNPLIVSHLGLMQAQLHIILPSIYFQNPLECKKIKASPRWSCFLVKRAPFLFISFNNC